MQPQWKARLWQLQKFDKSKNYYAHGDDEDA